MKKERQKKVLGVFTCIGDFIKASLIAGVVIAVGYFILWPSTTLYRLNPLGGPGIHARDIADKNGNVQVQLGDVRLAIPYVYFPAGIISKEQVKDGVLQGSFKVNFCYETLAPITSKCPNNDSPISVRFSLIDSTFNNAVSKNRKDMEVFNKNNLLRKTDDGLWQLKKPEHVTDRIYKNLQLGGLYLNAKDYFFIEDKSNLYLAECLAMCSIEAARTPRDLRAEAHGIPKEKLAEIGVTLNEINQFIQKFAQ